MFKHLRQAYGIADQIIEKLLAKAVKTINTDLSALNIAMENNDAEGCHKIAHSLKGAFLNLGFDELAEQAKSIEVMESIQDKTSKDIITSFIQTVGKLTLALG